MKLRHLQLMTSLESIYSFIYFSFYLIIAGLTGWAAEERMTAEAMYWLTPSCCYAVGNIVSRQMLTVCLLVSEAKHATDANIAKETVMLLSSRYFFHRCLLHPKKPHCQGFSSSPDASHIPQCFKEVLCSSFFIVFLQHITLQHNTPDWLAFERNYWAASSFALLFTRSMSVSFLFCNY